MREGGRSKKDTHTHTHIYIYIYRERERDRERERERERQIERERERKRDLGVFQRSLTPTLVQSTGYKLLADRAMNRYCMHDFQRICLQSNIL